MHLEILSEKQQALLPLLKNFNTNFFLVGGTAIALRLGHRQSIDYDLFTNQELPIESIRQTIRSSNQIDSIIVDSPTEQTLIVDQVKLTFSQYPFLIPEIKEREENFKIPKLITLGAMKAYALGRRTKWKDYVDLYFIIHQISLSELIDYTQNMFKSEFNPKLFREQLAYFDDIDYSEQVNFVGNQEIADDTIKSYLLEISVAK